MAQQQVFEHEVLARAQPGQNGRGQDAEEFEHTLSITNSAVRGFTLPQGTYLWVDPTYELVGVYFSLLMTGHQG